MQMITGVFGFDASLFFFIVFIEMRLDTDYAVGIVDP